MGLPGHIPGCRYNAIQGPGNCKRPDTKCRTLNGYDYTYFVHILEHFVEHLGSKQGCAKDIVGK